MACGGNTNDASGAPEKESPGAGSGGSRSKPAQPDDGSGGDKVGTGGHSAGSGGESGDSGLPEPDGEGGDGPVGDVVAETEKGIDPALAITDPALLGGKSFVLPKGLVPSTRLRSGGTRPTRTQGARSEPCTSYERVTRSSS